MLQIWSRLRIFMGSYIVVFIKICGPFPRLVETEHAVRRPTLHAILQEEIAEYLPQ
jgi:hypothetical protein